MRPRNWVPAVGWLGMALTVTLITGCSGSSAGSSQPAPTLPPAGKSTSVMLPLDAYTPQPQEQERADRAQAMLERTCVNAFGLHWSGPNDTELMSGRAMLAAQRANRFGLVDQTRAATYGYHPPPWSGQALSKADDKAEHDRPAADVLKVLAGTVTTFHDKPVPDGGCRGQAFRTLSEGTPPAPDQSVVTQLRADADTQVSTDHRVTSLNKAWSDCIAQSGQHYAKPADAARDDRWRKGATPSADEITVARADVACKNEVDYLPTLVRVISEYQQALMKTHADQLAQVKQLLDIRDRNARRALGVTATASEGR